MNEAAQQLLAIANEMDHMITGCDSHWDEPVPCYGTSFVVKPLQDWALRLTTLAQALSTPEKAGGVSPTAPATGDVVGWKGERHTPGVTASRGGQS